MMTLLIKKLKKKKLVENVFNTSYKLNALIVYIISPFVSGISDDHQNSRQMVIIARNICDYGFNVDVSNFDERNIKLSKYYDLVFDINVIDYPFYYPYLTDNAIKIAYFTGSNPAFLNKAEKDRLDLLYLRKGKRLKARRQVASFSRIVEDYSAVFFIGNKLNFSTYSDYNISNYYIIPNTSYDFSDFVLSKKNSKTFMYFASCGSVHKGLDLLLDVFSNNKCDLKLYVCGLYLREKDFCKLYKKELFHNPRIISMGFVDIWSSKFREICEESAFCVLPSCSEGMAGSILTCMSAGVIPICSKWCGFDESDEAIILPDCTIETIDSCINEVSAYDMDIITQKCEKVRDIAVQKYSENNFNNIVSAAFRDIIYNEK